jgi:hypothetical protein
VNPKRARKERAVVAFLPWFRKRGPLDESVAAIVAAESSAEGWLVLVIQPVHAGDRFTVDPATFTLSLWREDAGVYRLSLRNPRTGALAHVQGGAALASFADDLGLVFSKALT